MQLIEFTQAAIEAIAKFRETLDVPDDYHLRIGIKQKNAANKGLFVGFDQKTEKDKEELIAGIHVIYHPGQALFFAGMIIDFQEKENRKGFVLIEKNKR
jgi:iron-sulfur cluster assembly protein